MSLEGQILDGKYVIVRRIAEGGTSTVYLGVNQRIGKDVAVKVLHADVAQDPEVLERFEREARIVSRIRSPHVADVFDFGELETGERFMVMEYLEGESLATLLERERTIPARTLATITAQILDALAAAHAAGFVHRDLKPENIIVTTRGRDVIVKVVDFGISKIVDETSMSRMRVTAAGSVLGTPLYMSPEQARGHTSSIDHRTDLYSLGVILYEATAGEPPLTGDNVNDLLFRVALDDPEPLSSRVPSVAPALAAIVRRALTKDPNDRYQSADEMRDAVAEWTATFTSGAVTSLPPATEEKPRPRLGRFSRARVLAIAAPFIGIALFSSFSMGRFATASSPASVPAPAPVLAPAALSSSTSPSADERTRAVSPPEIAPLPPEPPSRLNAAPAVAIPAAPLRPRAAVPVVPSPRLRHPARLHDKHDLFAPDAGALVSVADLEPLPASNESPEPSSPSAGE